MRAFTLITLPFVMLSLSALALTESNAHEAPRHHSRDIARRARGDVRLYKRFDNAKFTFYDVGKGACGHTNQGSEFVVAVNSAQYGKDYPGPHCFKEITITYNGKSAQASVVDECPGCPCGGLDLSRGLFDYLADENQGVIYGSWWFNDDDRSNSFHC